MKANEFVKKFGVEEAKKVLHCMDDASEFNIYMPGDTLDKPTLIDAVGLRRLVESHDLVVNWKLPEDDDAGLDGAHLYLDYYATYSNDEEKAKLDRLKQAIADVESCQ